MADSQRDRIVWSGKALALAQKTKDLMVAVATGGPRIDAVKHDFDEQRKHLRAYLEALAVEDPIPFEELGGGMGDGRAATCPPTNPVGSS